MTRFQTGELLCYNPAMVGKDAFSHVKVGPDDVAFLKKVAADLPMLADLSRADLLLYCSGGPAQAITVAQARPHSSSPLYEESRVGLRVGMQHHAEVLRGLSGKSNSRRVHTVTVRGTMMARQVFPVRNARGMLVAVMTKDAYWLAHERHRRRSKVFQGALRGFARMVLRGELTGAESLAPFGEHDGIMYVGAGQRIRYMSGIASELYRHLGYRDSLVGHRIGDVDTVDHQLVMQAAQERRCFELQVEQDGLTWVRKALPVATRDEPRFSRWMRPGRARTSRLRGVFILIHDATEALRSRRELESQMALVREVHHRVKNSLQVIASILRLQARRVTSDEARDVLEESASRILSVAVVHEFLSHDTRGAISLLDVCRRIVGQIQRGLIDPEKRIQLSVKGPEIWLPAERATQCALVINELVQNAIEHGMAGRDEGRVAVELVDRGEKVSIVVTDDGEGLPEGFSLDTDANLGLDIVRRMVERDLRGQFRLLGTYGTRAIVDFGKSAQNSAS